MDRELVLGMLALLLCGAAMGAFGWLRAPTTTGSPLEEERTRWGAIWLPLLPAAVIFFALGGWALAEPDDAEPVPMFVLLLALPFAILWIRALVRAGRALMPMKHVAAATVGLVKPRVVVSPDLAAALDPMALAAAIQHETAHARHRDPLRIWLAQLATDLQWPWPAARRRFRSWLEALELARDAEARLDGVAGEDLAAAIVAAVQLSRAWTLAALDGNGVALVRRVAALLGPLPPMNPGRRAFVPVLLVAGLLVTALVFGATEGEPIVRTLLTGP